MNHEGYEIPFTWPDDSFEDETPGQQNSIYKRVPCMAGYRNNLTAISQSFNVWRLLPWCGVSACKIHSC